jgi:hypothetical protein
VFVPGKPFQPSLMFAGKAGAYPRVEHLMFAVKAGANPRLEHLKYVSPVNYGRKKFYKPVPGLILSFPSNMGKTVGWVQIWDAAATFGQCGFSSKNVLAGHNAMKNFPSKICNKLERLSSASHSSLV